MADIKYIITADAEGAIKEIKQVDSSIDGMKKQAEKAKSPLKGMWKQVAAGIGIASVLTSGMRILKTQVSDMITKGVEFGREWANVTTMLSTTEEETDKLRMELKNLSPTLGDTTELARAMYQVLSASVEPAEAIEFLGVAAKAAKAGITEAEVAVDALTTVINAYGLEAEDATEISDIMFQTVKMGKLTYDEMATSLGTIVPVASQVGIGFDEIGAAMATMTKQGIDANTATMQLRQILMAVLSPSKDASDAAKELGIQFDATALESKGLAEFLDDVIEGTGGSSEELVKLFKNVRAVTGVMALGGEAAEDFADGLNTIRTESGQTEEAFRKQMESAGFWIDTLKTSIDKFKIAFIEGFTSPLLEGITTSEDLDKKVEELTGKVEKFGEVLGTLNKFALTPLLTQLELASEKLQAVNFAKGGSFMSLVTTIVTQNIPAFKEFEDAIFAVDEDFTGLNAGIEFGEGILKDFNKALKDSQEWLRNMGNESEITDTKIGKLPITLELTKFEVQEMQREWTLLTDIWGESIDVIEENELALESMRIEGIDTAETLKLVMNDVFEAVGIKVEDWGAQVGEVTKAIKNDFQIATERMKDAWAREIGGMIAEFKSFKDFFNDILGEMWRIFADMVGKMIVKWATDFLQDTLFKQTKKAVSDVTGALTGGDGAGGLLGAGTGAAGGLWTGIGAAAGTLLAGLITGPGVSARTGQDQLQEIRLTNILLYQTQQNELHWMDEKLAAIADYTGARIPLKQDKTNRLLRKIYDELKGVPSGQKGLDFYSGSRGGLARYHRDERVTIQPRTSINIAPQPIHNHFYVGSKKMFSQLTYASKHGHFKLHERVTKRF